MIKEQYLKLTILNKQILKKQLHIQSYIQNIKPITVKLKSACSASSKILIWPNNPMLWVLKRSISLSRFFCVAHTIGFGWILWGKRAVHHSLAESQSLSCKWCNACFLEERLNRCITCSWDLFQGVMFITYMYVHQILLILTLIPLYTATLNNI